MPRRNENESWVDYAQRLGITPTASAIINLQQAEQLTGGMREVPDHFTWNGNVVHITPQSSAAQVLSNESQSPNPKKPDAIALKKLEKLSNAIISERNLALADKPYLDNGRKSSEYLNLLRTKKEEALTSQEILNTEIPLCVCEVDTRKLSALLRENPRLMINKSLVCAKCALEVPSWALFFLNKNVFCAEHLPKLKMCGSCDFLQEGCKSIKTFDNREVLMCPSCTQRNNRCRYCEKSISREYWEIRMCAQCLERTDREAPFRRFSRGLAWIGTEVGEVVKSKRMFSAELEGLSPQRSYAQNLYQHLPKEMGIAHDGSVDGTREGLYGFEVVTPRLGGKKGEELVSHVVAVLKNIDASVNETCGMHVHLDGKGIMVERNAYPASLVQLWKAYIVFEDVITSFLPFARRGNDFCRPLSEAFKLSELDLIETLIDAEKLWYKEGTWEHIRAAKHHHYHSSRYFSINFHCLFGEGHLEIRSHSATTNARKVLEWANLHALIVDAAEKKLFTPDFLKEAQVTSELRSKTSMLFNKICLAEKSRQYFRTRQHKFGDKRNDEDEPKAKKVKRPPVEIITDEVDASIGSITLQDMRAAFNVLDNVN